MYDKTKRVIDLAIEKYHLKIIKDLKRSMVFLSIIRLLYNYRTIFLFLPIREAYQILRI